MEEQAAPAAGTAGREAWRGCCAAEIEACS